MRDGRKMSVHELEKLAHEFGARDASVDRTSLASIRVRVRHPVRCDEQETLAKKMAKETGIMVEVIERTG